MTPFSIVKIVLISILFSFQSTTSSTFFIPINIGNRKLVEPLKLTEIGSFGKLRKARKNVPEHYHTGIDICRPSQNYTNELIYPITKGIVISKRTDGPYAQLIIEHRIEQKKFWTVYEHIAGIKVNLGDIVNPLIAIARYMNKEELNKYGWQFDHFHFEIVKKKPIVLAYDKKHPERKYSSFSLVCYTKKDLLNYFEDPIQFLITQLNWR